MGVALPAEELGDLGLDRSLDEQAHAEASDLLQHVAQVTVGGEQVVDVGADALQGDTRVDTGVGSFLCLQGFERNLRPRLFTPGTGRHRALVPMSTAGECSGTPG